MLDTLDRYHALFVALIQRAYQIYQTNAYEDAGDTLSFLSPRDDALCFFHSPAFACYCEYLDVDPFFLRERMDIAQPTDRCECPWCKTDYRDIAELVQHRDPRRYRFAVGQRHWVRWQHGARGSFIVRVYPLDYEGPTLSAVDYLKKTKAA